MENSLKIQIPNNNTNERLYAINSLVETILGISAEIETLPNSEYTSIVFDDKKICIKDSFFNRFPQPLSYLAVENLPDPKYFFVEFSPENNTPILYGDDTFVVDTKYIECGIDLFAGAFFMLSRWEEYCVKDVDIHNRFIGKNSVAFKSGFINRPIVNEYAEILWNMLSHLGYKGSKKVAGFEYNLTHDIDILCSNSRLKSVAGDILKRRDIRMAISRLLPPYTDPVDTYDFLMTESEKLCQQSTFYLMAADYKPDNSNGKGYLDNKKFTQLVADIKSRKHKIGFHPSYGTCANADKWKKEKLMLEKAAQTDITLCRQHFLQISVPQTFRILEDNNITSDSTLGYPDCEGFRCGTGSTFILFDFLNRRETSVCETPLIVMDTTIWVQHLPFEKITDIYNHYIAVGRKYNMPITLLFHNSSFDNYRWKGWKQLYSQIINTLK